MDVIERPTEQLKTTDLFDWRQVSYLLLLSRAMDTIEEQELVPAKLVFNQFSARGHDLAQILLGKSALLPRVAMQICAGFRCL